MTTPAERVFAEQVGAWTPPWNREAESGEETQASTATELEAVAKPEAAAESAEEPALVEEPAPERDPEPVEEPESEVEPEPLDPLELRSAIEAILLIVDEPVTDVILAQVLGQPTETITQTLTDLAEDYTTQRRGFELRRAAGGWRLYTRGEFASYVEKFVLDGQQTRLTQAALETLAVVAYKQPVTRGRVDGKQP